MMKIRKPLVLLWMLFPVGVAAYHFNAGPKQMARERAHAQLEETRRLTQEKEPNWEEIIRRYHRYACEYALGLVDQEDANRSQLIMSGLGLDEERRVDGAWADK